MRIAVRYIFQCVIQGRCRRVLDADIIDDNIIVRAYRASDGDVAVPRGRILSVDIVTEGGIVADGYKTGARAARYNPSAAVVEGQVAIDERLLRIPNVAGDGIVGVQGNAVAVIVRVGADVDFRIIVGDVVADDGMVLHARAVHGAAAPCAGIQRYRLPRVDRGDSPDGGV